MALTKPSNTMLPQMPANTIKGNNTGGTADSIDLSVAQVQTMLSVPTLASGTYVPTITQVANMDGPGSTAYNTMYIRVGNIVYVSGFINPKPTASNAVCSFTLTLPIVPINNFGSSTQLAGGCNANASGQSEGSASGNILASTGAKQAWITWYNNNGAAIQNMRFWFTYQLV